MTGLWAVAAALSLLLVVLMVRVQESYIGAAAEYRNHNGVPGSGETCIRSSIWWPRMTAFVPTPR
jgi:hypothetical protein